MSKDISLFFEKYFVYYNMPKKMTRKQRAIEKVIACIDSSTNIEHMVACKKMIQLIYNYGVKNKIRK